MSETEKKKTRRQWLYDEDTGDLTTNEATFNMAEITTESDLFLRLYGCKQYLADKIASKGGEEFSDSERADAMQERFSNLTSDKFKLVHTESGFYFKDPNATTKRGGGVMVKKIYDACIAEGKSDDEARDFVKTVTGKVYEG